MPDDPTPDPTPDPVPDPQPDDLGEAGKKALADERSLRKAAEKAANALTGELEKLRAASMSDQEKAVATARAEGKADAFKEANERILRSEVRAAAAGKLADPDDAVSLLDLSSFVTTNGDIDNKAITSAIDALVKQKPYLGAMPGNGAGEGGPRGASPPPTSKDPLLDDIVRVVGASRR